MTCANGGALPCASKPPPNSRFNLPLPKGRPVDWIGAVEEGRIRLDLSPCGDRLRRAQQRRRPAHTGRGSGRPARLPRCPFRRFFSCRGSARLRCLVRPAPCLPPIHSVARGMGHAVSPRPFKADAAASLIRQIAERARRLRPARAAETRNRKPGNSTHLKGAVRGEAACALGSGRTPNGRAGGFKTPAPNAS